MTSKSPADLAADTNRNLSQPVKSVVENAADSMDRTGSDCAAQPYAEINPLPEPSVKTTGADIRVTDGMLVPQSLSESTRIAKGLLESGAIPKQYKTVSQVIMGMQVLRQLGLPDIACLPRLAIINGSFSLWGEGTKAVCQAEIEDFEEFLFDKDYNRICFANKNLDAEVFGALCKVRRFRIPSVTERCFTIRDAERAGLRGKQGPWREYESRMLQMRARSWALKDAFPDRLMGISVAEYDHHAMVSVSGEVVPTIHDRAPELADRFKEVAK